MRAAEAIKELRNKANKSQAALAQRFFKTAKGDYGYGDIFIGVKVPVIRQIARRYQLLSLPEIEKLTSSKLHEVRLCGLVIITRHRNSLLSVARYDEIQRWKRFHHYLPQ